MGTNSNVNAKRKIKTVYVPANDQYIAMNDEPREKNEETLEWYYRPWVIVLAILCLGPLGLLPLWFRPRTNMFLKVSVSVVVIGLTVWMTKESVDFYQTMLAHYRELGEALK